MPFSGSDSGNQSGDSEREIMDEPLYKTAGLPRYEMHDPPHFDSFDDFLLRNFATVTVPGSPFRIIRECRDHADGMTLCR